MAIQQIDLRLSALLNEVLHHPRFQRLEAAWRSLAHLVERADFRENIKVELLVCSKDDLARDLLRGDIERSGLYHIVYGLPYGVHPLYDGPAGRPYGLLVGDYEFGPDARDVALLGRVAEVASRAHAPFLAGAAPSMCGVAAWGELPAAADINRRFEEPRFAAWRAFRDRDDANHVGLCLPRFLLRAPYGRESAPESFLFVEEVRGQVERYLWGNASVALAACVADAFARYRLCANIIGPHAGGAVEGLPAHRYTADGESREQLPVECALSERREYELSEQGLIGLSYSSRLGVACFFSAQSARRPGPWPFRPDAPSGPEAKSRFLLSGFPYLFILSRVAQYLKVIHFLQCRGMDRAQVERALDDWLSEYTADFNDPRPKTRGPKLFMTGSVRVDAEPGAPWRRVELRLHPMFRYMGQHFELALTGRLDPP